MEESDEGWEKSHGASDGDDTEPDPGADTVPVGGIVSGSKFGS